MYDLGYDESHIQDRREPGQGSLLPPRVEDYVGPDNPVRAIEGYVYALDLAKLGFRHADRGAEVASRPTIRPIC